ncbi:MAG: SRPBCC family protein [Actinomycetota bacterium]|nr:SRPBCC family protein [Actinomycetota bacterium]
MELRNDFHVSVPVEQAWDVLTDLPRIAPCMPGAQLQSVEGEEYHGVVKVKVGPITAQYKGVARFVERDQEARRAVMRAEGRDTRGQGTASATVTAVLAPDDDGTAVSIVTDLAITGKVAQFGRGVLADVSGRLLDQFAQRLEADVLSGGDAATPGALPEEVAAERGGAGATRGAEDAERSAREAAGGGAGENGAARSTGSGTLRSMPDHPVEPVDLLAVAGPSLRRRLVPLAAAVAAAIAVLVWRWRRH